MKKLIIVSIVMCVITGCSHVKQVFFQDDREAMRLLHNEYRVRIGLSELKSNEMLEKAAQKHAQWMADHEIMSHYEGRKAPWDRAREEGYSYSAMGENIAEIDTAEATFNTWLHSRGHRQNIQGGYSEFGVGVAESKSNRKYWAVLFGLPRASIYSLRR